MDKKQFKRRGQPYQTLGSFRADRFIAPLVDSLNQAGVVTRGCCHGHVRGDTITAPYVSFATSFFGLEFLNRVERFGFLLIMEWVVTTVTDPENKDQPTWFSLFTSNSLIRRAGNKWLYRLAINWDARVLALLARTV